MLCGEEFESAWETGISAILTIPCGKYFPTRRFSKVYSNRLHRAECLPPQRRNDKIHDFLCRGQTKSRSFISRCWDIALFRPGWAIPDVASVLCLDGPNDFLKLVILDQLMINQLLAHFGKDLS